MLKLFITKPKKIMGIPIKNLIWVVYCLMWTTIIIFTKYFIRTLPS